MCQPAKKQASKGIIKHAAIENVRIDNERMSERLENDVENLPIETFNKVLEAIQKKSGNKYDFVVKGGASLKEALFHLYKSIWKTEMIPQHWKNQWSFNRAKPKQQQDSQMT